MPIELLIFLILMLALVGVVCAVWGGNDHIAPLFFGGCIGCLLAIFGFIWAIGSYTQPWEVNKTDYYMPVSVTFEDGAKVQLIMVEGAIINCSHLFSSIIPDDKLIKRITWKDKYSGIVYSLQGRKIYFVVPKSEKQ